ncbi:hypothetical protein H2198_003557 [Neophaeococcomyces mojaviensis]|uniref:Uncharacterized protein n=1 Tax=Neophaeococcomyces mojaviensis TaxID=3383035 RepID=A0ACC3AB55_9EURO|nr:hypothetical protein H2198_003557 [Knufia sp. JES_112]
MVLLELIIIGGAVYYYKKHHKENKARKLAFAAGQPYRERDGSVTYPPAYPNLPPYPSSNDHKVQFGEDSREYYSDAPAAGLEKGEVIVETRETVTRNDKA